MSVWRTWRRVRHPVRSAMPRPVRRARRRLWQARHPVRAAGWGIWRAVGHRARRGSGRRY